MSIFARYSILFSITAMVCSALVNWMQITFMQSLGAFYFQRVGPSLLITAGFILIVLLVVKSVISPFEKVVNRIAKGGAPATDAERTLALQTYRKMNGITSIATLIGYACGGSISMIIKMAKGALAFNPDRVVFGIIQSLLFGGIVILYAVYGLNEMFEDSRKLLNIKTLNKNQRATTIRGMLITMFVVSILFCCCNVMMVSYGIIDRQKSGVVGTALAEYYGYGILVTIISLVMSIGILVLVLTRLTNRIEKTSNVIQKITEGDLSHRVSITMLDDFGVLSSYINALMDRVEGILVSIQKESKVVQKAAGKLNSISSTLQSSLQLMSNAMNRIQNEGKNQNDEITKIEIDILSLAEGVRKVENRVLNTTTSIQQSSASITEMTQNINSVAELTKRADDVSINLSGSSVDGNKQIQEAIDAISEIQESSQTVQDMVRIIQQVASQTNLLSMNAAIEAAHAGNYGQGFAVVANEVRSLAASSSKSTAEIRNRIKDMVAKINKGFEAITAAGSAFNDITTSAEENKKVIQTISNAMTEQKIGAEENLKATTLVVDDSDKIKSLVLEQRQHTENVELAMKSVVGSSKQVLAAIDECSSASVNLGNILSDIEDMIKENRQAVEQMETQINSFQFQSNKVDSNEEQESEDFGVEVLDFAEEVPEEVIEEKPVETAKTETLSTEDFFATDFSSK